MARRSLDPSFADSDDNFDEADDIVLADSHPPVSQQAVGGRSPSGSSSDSCTLSTGDLSSSTRSDLSAASSSTSLASKTRFLFPKVDTVESLRPEEVRWFYKEEGDKKWTPFIGYDSLRIECKFREIIHRLGHLAAPDTPPGDAPEHDSEMINVRGGIYGVNVLKRKCFPVYWSTKEESLRVMRGTWFVDGTWQPLDENHSNQIETEHLSKFENQKLPEDESETGRNPLPAGTRLRRGFCHEAHMEDKPPDITHLIFVVHGIGQKMDTGNIVKRCADIRESTQRVCDKYFSELRSSNKRAEFLPVEWRSTLRLDGDTVESITPNKVKGLRTILNSSAMDILYYTSPLYRSEHWNYTQCLAAFLNWITAIFLITQGLQTELNRLYLEFCQRHPYFEANGGKVSILAHSLGSVIAYDIITGWNPIQLYDQYVSSVIGDSVDSCNGITAQQSQEEKCLQVQDTSTLVSELEEARQRVHELEHEILKRAERDQIKTPNLKFTLDTFFTLGSPLAVFLALRGVRPSSGRGTQEDILPASLCRRMYNIYHPSDPIAYRLEPLIMKHYEGLMPLRIHRFDSPFKPAYDVMPRVSIARVNNQQAKKKSASALSEEKSVETKNEKLGGEALKVHASDQDASPKKGWSKVFRRSRKLSVEEALSAEMTVFDRVEKVTSDCDDDDDDWVNYDVMFERTELEHRLDYQVKEGKMENSYLATLTSHFSYWSNLDLALFIMTQIFPESAPTSPPPSL
ncbi:hypothetical protein CAPTEDRAFT_197144 [Capitella teleta]|uniref:DDHD domain-containing protein n=1 Tax=Capitella teleta TaxID=283909 RepID=R7U8B3_CAPTE|nr:hypothetical protein CAPTEDRAFT_197144 [Capitella teleta]|eukprot:ELT99325.1 hypothetical protein CAPTEDRAFT_197144 [Capitella teleta]